MLHFLSNWLALLLCWWDLETMTVSLTFLLSARWQCDLLLHITATQWHWRLHVMYEILCSPKPYSESAYAVLAPALLFSLDLRYTRWLPHLLSPKASLFFLMLCSPPMTPSQFLFNWLSPFCPQSMSIVGLCHLCPTLVSDSELNCSWGQGLHFPNLVGLIVDDQAASSE